MTFRAWIAISLGVPLALACSSADLVLPHEATPTPAAIEVTNGDGQTGEVNQPLDLLLEVMVTDDAGDPVSGATVIFELTSAGEGGSISPSPARTDAAGKAEASVVLGDKLGVQTGAAHVMLGDAMGPGVSFSATAKPIDPEPPGGNPHNRSPEADYNWHCEELSCEFTNASTDRDGAVVQWSWNFGDGETSAESDPAHRYSSPGTYSVTLIVTDNDGATDETTAHVDVGED